jgi:hypothetical protein
LRTVNSDRIIVLDPYPTRLPLLPERHKWISASVSHSELTNPPRSAFVGPVVHDHLHPLPPPAERHQPRVCVRSAPCGLVSRLTSDGLIACLGKYDNGRCDSQTEGRRRLRGKFDDLERSANPPSLGVLTRRYWQVRCGGVIISCGHGQGRGPHGIPSRTLTR